jgi:hypothetical protein
MHDRPKISATLMALLTRSQELHTSVLDRLEGEPMPGLRRMQAAYAALGLSYNHAHAMQHLLAHRHYPSAFALLRVQFDAVVRGMWILFAASEEWIDRFYCDRIGEPDCPAPQPPSLNEMLDASAAQNAPPGIVIQLCGLGGSSWFAMCSYTHTGQHPISRFLSEYTQEEAVEILQVSNGLIALATKLMTIALNRSEIAPDIARIFGEFADCFPGSAVPPGIE